MFKMSIFFADRFDRLVLRGLVCVNDEMIVKYTEVHTNIYFKKLCTYVYLDQIEFSCSEIILDLGTMQVGVY
jgi:hypothetical protein